MRIWRICRKRHASTAFSGEGARLAGGRWNSEGIAMAYASENLSLAALELFVHAEGEEQPADLVAVQAEIPVEAKMLDRQREEWRKNLPEDWRFHREVSQRLGDAWARAKKSLAVRVPSVLIDVEWNVLINPEHTDASKVKIVQERPFRFDERMFKGKR